MRSGFSALVLVGLLTFTGGMAACGEDTPAADAGSPADTTTMPDGGTDDVAVADTTPSEDTTVAVDTTAAKDTAGAADTATPPEDTTPAADVPPVEKLCLDHLTCAKKGCAGLEGDDAAKCLTDAQEGCGIADDEGEGTLAGTLITCLATAGCQVPDVANASDSAWATYYKCASANCFESVAACYAGTYGEGDCEDMRKCSLDCEPDFLTGKATPACLRACGEKTSKSSVEHYIELEYCLLQQCYDKPDYDACVQQSAGIFCPNEYDTCYGTQQ